MTGTAFIKN